MDYNLILLSTLYGRNYDSKNELTTNFSNNGNLLL